MRAMRGYTFRIRMGAAYNDISTAFHNPVDLNSFDDVGRSTLVDRMCTYLAIKGNKHNRRKRYNKRNK